MKREEFLRIATPAFLLMANGKFVKANELFDIYRKKKRLFRFIVASDGHYGQKDTEYEKYFAKLVECVNDEHRKNPLAFCMINGDIIHDDPVHFPAAKKALDALQVKYYVTQGNHDHVSQELWQNIWNIPVNYDFAVSGTSFIAGTTSNEKGEYLPPDIAWLDKALQAHSKQKNVFIFIHINPAKLTKYAIDSPEFFNILSKYKNVRAVFNGHDHDEEGIKTKNNIPFVFDAHLGGSWGTSYRGYRVVELMKDGSVFTYIKNPMDKINEATL